MKMKILIASATKPVKGGTYENLYAIMQKAALEEFNVLVTKGIFVPGPGCNNYALELVGKEKNCNDFGRALCFALMPSKWGGTDDHIPDGFTCELETNSLCG